MLSNLGEKQLTYKKKKTHRTRGKLLSKSAGELQYNERKIAGHRRNGNEVSFGGIQMESDNFVDTRS